MFLIFLSVCFLGRVIAQTNVEASTSETGQFIYNSTPNSTAEVVTNSFSLANNSEGSHNDNNVENPPLKEEADYERLKDKQFDGSSESHQNEEPVELDNGESEGNSTELEKTTEDDYVDWLHNGNDEFTTDAALSVDEFNDTTEDIFNGSMNETADDIFDVSYNETDQDIFNSTDNESANDIFNSNNETAYDIFNGFNSTDNESANDIFNSNNETADDLFNGQNNKLYENSFHNSTKHNESDSDLGEILQGWLAEQTNETISKTLLKTLSDGNLFTGAVLNHQDGVCFSLNISIQIILKDIPLKLSPAYKTTGNFSMNNGSITFHISDNENNYNVSTEFLIHCDTNDKSCGVQLMSVEIFNLTKREGLYLNSELCRPTLGTKFEVANKKTFNVTDEMQFEIIYISGFVSDSCFLILESFFGKHYVEILSGIGGFVLVAIVAFFIVRMVQRNRRQRFIL